MAKLTNSVGTFQTGDLVFTRYPPKSPQPIHVTLFLDGTAGGPRYVHAGATQLEIAAVGTYASDKDSGGYLHAHTTDTTLRTNAAAVAQLFAQTVTPYGSYPGTKDFTRIGITPESPHASRFTGMIRTQTVGEIPFEFPALQRLLKWTLRAIRNEPLSEHRGITCAAFASICQQVARMRAYLEEAGVGYQPDKIESCLRELDKLVQKKADLRKSLELLATDPQTGKKIYRDQAYRENSNRDLTAQGRRTLQKAKKDVDWTALNDDMAKAVKRHAPSAELEQFWLVIQTQHLEIHPALAEPIRKILNDGFFFDAKYVSSIALSKHIVTLPKWKTTEYTEY